MKLHCPHCGVKGSTDDSYSGRKVKCPECKELFVVSPGMVIVSPEAPEENVELADAHEELMDTPVAEALDEGGGEDETPEEPVLAEPEEEFEEEFEVELEVEPEEEPEEEFEVELKVEPEEEPDEEPGEEERDDETATLEEEIEQEPYGIEKNQCWECGIEESSDESFITSNGRLYCTNCVQPESPDVESEVEEESVEPTGEFEKSETHEAPENDIEPEEPAKGGAWAKLKRFFKK